MKTGQKNRAADIPGPNPHFILILSLTLIVPLAVMPGIIDNAFNTPKTLLMVIFVLCMTFIYLLDYLRGRPVLASVSNTHYITLFIIFLDFVSLLYTKNIYFTRVAALLNITCLVFFTFVSLYVDGKRAGLLITAATLSGFLVSIIVWLQFFDIYLLFPWSSPGDIMGTIGNSNYLGAYLIFPLYTSAGLIFLKKGKTRMVTASLCVMILAAFLFSRARASWVGFFVSLPVFLYLLKRIHGIPVSKYFATHRRKIAGCGLILVFVLGVMGFAAPRRFQNMVDVHRVFEPETLRLRVRKYFPPSIWIFKQSPLFGMGLWSYRNTVYEAQAEISKKNPDFFKQYDAPKPRRVHNEYLEILNDGGLVAAGGLLMLFLSIMSHGRLIMGDKRIAYQDRVIAAVCFCSLIAVMLTALFFFPFRVNSSLFMTVFMMGIMEGTYLRNRDLIVTRQGRKTGTGPLLTLLIFFTLIGVLWHAGIKPLKGEMEYLQYKKSISRGSGEQAERHLLRAIEYDPRNTMYLLNAGQLYMTFFRDYLTAGEFVERAIMCFNGDVTLWSAYYIKGLIQFRMGHIPEARSAFETSLYYHPYFTPAREKLSEVKKLMEEHDSVTIKFR